MSDNTAQATHASMLEAARAYQGNLYSARMPTWLRGREENHSVAVTVTEYSKDQAEEIKDRTKIFSGIKLKNTNQTDALHQFYQNTNNGMAPEVFEDPATGQIQFKTAKSDPYAAKRCVIALCKKLKDENKVSGKITIFSNKLSFIKSGGELAAILGQPFDYSTEDRLTMLNYTGDIAYIEELQALAEANKQAKNSPTTEMGTDKSNTVDPDAKASPPKKPLAQAALARFKAVANDASMEPKVKQARLNAIIKVASSDPHAVKAILEEVVNNSDQYKEEARVAGRFIGSSESKADMTMKAFRSAIGRIPKPFNDMMLGQLTAHSHENTIEGENLTRSATSVVDRWDMTATWRHGIGRATHILGKEEEKVQAENSFNIAVRELVDPLGKNDANTDREKKLDSLKILGIKTDSPEPESTVSVESGIGCQTNSDHEKGWEDAEYLHKDNTLSNTTELNSTTDYDTATIENPILKHDTVTIENPILARANENLAHNRNSSSASDHSNENEPTVDNSRSSSQGFSPGQ